MSTSLNHQAVCRLLGLPAGLRNHIYEDFLVHSDGVTLRTCSPSRPGACGACLAEDINSIRLSGIFGSCGKIYNEAVTVFYKQNEFKLVMPEGDRTGEIVGYHSEQAGIWLESLGTCLKYLRYVDITIPPLVTPWTDEFLAIPHESSISLLSICREFLGGSDSSCFEGS
jgi:hypothetical protein